MKILKKRIEESDDLDPSVKKERNKVLKNLEKGKKARGVRIVGIEKVYRKHQCIKKSKNDVHAIKGIHIEVPQ